MTLAEGRAYSQFLADDETVFRAAYQQLVYSSALAALDGLQLQHLAEVAPKLAA